MAIDVIIPVLGQAHYTRSVLEDLDRQTLQPRKIFIIDNGADRDNETAARSCSSLSIEYLRQKKNIGVNASWNLGIKHSEAEIVAILNNDLILPPFFLTLVLSAFLSEKNLGIVIPAQSNKGSAVRGVKQPSYLRLVPSQRREGWAFSIRRDLAQRIGPIPLELFMFFGDDWFFGGARRLGYGVFRLIDVPVFHHIGVSAQVRSGGDLKINTLYNKEKRVWHKLTSR